MWEVPVDAYLQKSIKMCIANLFTLYIIAYFGNHRIAGCEST